MPRPDLFTHPKFIRLVDDLGMPEPHVLGHLEYLWRVGYERGREIVGDERDVELAAKWPRERRGELCKALVTCGFLDALPDGRYAIHDLAINAPQYVSRRAGYEAERQKVKLCEHCGSEFHSRETRARFCGDRCRVAAGRKRHAEDHDADANERVTNTSGSVRNSCAPPAPAPAPAPAPNSVPLERGAEGADDDIISEGAQEGGDASASSDANDTPAAPRTRRPRTGTTTRKPEKPPLPFRAREALDEVERFAEGRFFAPKTIEGGHAIRIEKVIRDYGDLRQWAEIGKWLAKGGGDRRGIIDVGTFVKMVASWFPAVAAWAKGGRKPIEAATFSAGSSSRFNAPPERACTTPGAAETDEMLRRRNEAASRALAERNLLPKARAL